MIHCLFNDGLGEPAVEIIVTGHLGEQAINHS
jgi:hypothetical protein